MLDTNVRRVLSRISAGLAFPPPDRDGGRARGRTHSCRCKEDVRLDGRHPMELGALICTARAPTCRSCPVSDLCGGGAPAIRHLRPTGIGATKATKVPTGSAAGAPRRVQVRRRASATTLSCQNCWPEAAQRARALASLIRDGLVISVDERRYPWLRASSRSPWGGRKGLRRRAELESRRRNREISCPRNWPRPCS